MPVVNKVVLQVGWYFRQLGALTKDRTYQGSFSALASICEGDDVFAMHRNLCQSITVSQYQYHSMFIVYLSQGSANFFRSRAG